MIYYILLCQAVGLSGTYATRRSLREWFPQLKKPALNPPAWVFGPVWTLLYLLMAIAGWRVSGYPEAKHWFYVQLVLNGLWTPLFFGLRRPGLAFVEMLLMLLAIARCITVFAAFDPLAAALFVPYQAWVGFAAYLNFEIWRLNRRAAH